MNINHNKPWLKNSRCYCGWTVLKGRSVFIECEHCKSKSDENTKEDI